MTSEQWIAAIGIIAPVVGVIAGIWWERRKTKRTERREDEEEEDKRLLTFSQANAQLRTWLVAENDKLRERVRAVEKLLNIEQAARFDDRSEIWRLAREVEYLTAKVEHLESEFQKNNITPMPFIRGRP